MLNDEQKKVVYANERFLFLLAGAGSGKTRVIVERIKYLINSGVDPNDILAITFTRKAAHEMKSRVHHENVCIHTFHQLAYLSIKAYENKDIQLLEEDHLPFHKKDILEVSKYKNSYFKTSKPKIYDAYQRHLQQNAYVDFDDLLIIYYKLVKQHKVIPNYRYIFVDEFQDTNLLQYMLLKVLIHKETSVFAVGDPDQSIYQFRGANRLIIDQYIKEFHAKLYTLKMNYRSNQTIIHHANRIIMRNNRKHPKILVPMNTQTSLVYHSIFQNDVTEASTIIKLIQYFISQKINPEEIAVLYRNHYRAYTLKMMLKEQRIDYQIDQENVSFGQGIQLLTIHKAKGLEFDCVIIMGLEQGVLPSRLDNRQIICDEERRLMFVAITRARHYLCMTTIKINSDNHTFTSSQFARESGVKTINEKHFNDIISLGDLCGYQTKNQ